MPFDSPLSWLVVGAGLAIVGELLLVFREVAINTRREEKRYAYLVLHVVGWVCLVGGGLCIVGSLVYLVMLSSRHVAQTKTVGGMMLRRWRMENWPTKDEVMQELGISERTLDRRVNELSIQKAFRQVAGRKPIPLLDPAGVAKLKALQVQPNPVTVKTPPRQLPQRFQTNGHNAAMIPPSLSQALMDWFANLTGPQYLTLRDAAIQTGLPMAHLKQAIKSGRLPAVKVGRSWRLLRGDVVSYRVEAGTID